MSDVKEFIKIRGTIKSRLTLFATYLDPLIKIKSSECTKLQLKELSLRLSKLQDLFTNFDEVQMKIEELDPESDKQLKERQDVENRFYHLIAQTQDLIENWHRSLNESVDVQSNAISFQV
ncbi:hypothetical protein ACJJTC_017874 [Scirpophaga incertulas]